MFGGNSTMIRNITFTIMIFMICLMTNSVAMNEVLSERFTMIPDEAIRLRILANSNDERDQQVKLAVRDQVSSYINHLVAHVETIEEARVIIHEHLPYINELVARTLHTYEKTDDFNVAFQQNVPFPEKTYGSYVYPEGDYE